VLDYANVLVKVFAILGVTNHGPAAMPSKETINQLFRKQRYPAVAHIWIHSVNLTLGPKSGSENKCRARGPK